MLHGRLRRCCSIGRLASADPRGMLISEYCSQEVLTALAQRVRAFIVGMCALVGMVGMLMRGRARLTSAPRVARRRRCRTTTRRSSATASRSALDSPLRATPWEPCEAWIARTFGRPLSDIRFSRSRWGARCICAQGWPCWHLLCVPLPCRDGQGGAKLSRGPGQAVRGLSGARRSVGRSGGWSMGQAAVRGRLVGLSDGGWAGGRAARKVGQSLGRSVGRPDGRSVGRSHGRAVGRVGGKIDLGC